MSTPTPFRPVPFSSALVALVLALVCASCSDDGQPAGDSGGDVGDGGAGDMSPDADMAPVACGVGVSRGSLLAAAQLQPELASCYAESGEECAEDNASIGQALDDLAATAASCSDAEVEGLLASSSMVSADAWSDRLVEEQLRGARAMARHAYGGPRGLLYADADSDLKACIDAVYSSMSGYYQTVLEEKSTCLTTEGCDAEAHSGVIDAARDAAAERIDDGCGSFDLAAITFTIDHLLEIAEQQADCGVASITTLAGDIPVACGPANDQVAAADNAEEWIAVTLDSEVWGTKCGDGSDFSFWWRLGSEPGNVFIDLQGGGVCLDEADCRAALADGRLTAADEMQSPPQNQWNEDDPANPFRNWTYAYVPYCNQDVFGGGGNTETLDDDDSDGPFNIERYGGRNVQAVARYLRDAVWTHLDETGAAGYQGNEIRAFYAGTSAGGFGIYFHHPYLLDTIGWPNTVANPRVWLSLSDPTTPIEGIFVLKLNSWALRDAVPTSCNTPPCATGSAFLARHAPRLDERSMFLVISGQSDVTQYRETFHPSIFVWTNLARESYCDQQGRDNVRWFFPANPEPYQALIDGVPWDSTNNGHSVGDQFVIGDLTLRQWLGDAVDEPGSAVDQVEEGNLVALSQDDSLLDEPAYEEIRPFDCLQ